MNEQNGSLIGLQWKIKHQNKNSTTICECREWDLPGEIALQCFSTMSSWNVLAVWAARLWTVCMCVWDWWVWECVRKYSATQESNVAACGFLTGSIVVEGDMFSWGKARPVLSRTPTPPTLHPPHPHPGDPSKYTNCINCTVKEDRVGQRIPLQCSVFLWALHRLSVLACMCVLGPDCTKCTVRMVQYCLESKFHSYTSVEDFKWTDLS